MRSGHLQRGGDRDQQLHELRGRDVQRGCCDDVHHVPGGVLHRDGWDGDGMHGVPRGDVPRGRDDDSG